MALRQNSDKEPSIELFIKVSLFFLFFFLSVSLITCNRNRHKVRKYVRQKLHLNSLSNKCAESNLIQYEFVTDLPVLYSLL